MATVEAAAVEAAAVEQAAAAEAAAAVGAAAAAEAAEAATIETKINSIVAMGKAPKRRAEKAATNKRLAVEAVATTTRRRNRTACAPQASCRAEGGAESERAA